MQPTTCYPPAVQRPPLSRRLAEMIQERRPPGRISRCIDSLAIACGQNEKVIRRNGLLFRVRRNTVDEKFVEKIVVGGEYSPPGYEIDADTVVDIGANIGSFTIDAARKARRVIAVEPNSDNFRLLRSNLKLNRVWNVLDKHAAASDTNGLVNLFCASEGGFHSIEADRSTDESEQVQSMTLAHLFDICNVEHCNFLKVDCEGAEHRIFHTLPAGVFARIDKIAMEWHGVENRDERIAQGEALVDRLVEHGFHIDLFTEHAGFRCGHIFARRL